MVKFARILLVAVLAFSSIGITQIARPIAPITPVSLLERRLIARPTPIGCDVTISIGLNEAPAKLEREFLQFAYSLREEAKKMVAGCIGNRGVVSITLDANRASAVVVLLGFGFDGRVLPTELVDTVAIVPGLNVAAQSRKTAGEIAEKLGVQEVARF